MAIKIRNNEKVCGIKFRNIEYKICQLADDTTIFVKDTDSIIQLLSVMKKFQNCSGLKSLKHLEYGSLITPKKMLN